MGIPMVLRGREEFRNFTDSISVRREWGSANPAIFMAVWRSSIARLLAARPYNEPPIDDPW